MRGKMPLLINFLVLFSCSETTVNEVGKSGLDNSITKEIVEEIDVLEEQDVALSFYQLAVQKHEKKSLFPSDVVIQPNDELYNKGSLIFHKIIKSSGNYFLLAYKTHATAIENTYYLTFDYNGNQIDAALVNTYAIDLDGKIVFNTDTTFQVNKVTKEIEWDEADVIEIGEPKNDTTYYTITNKGLIIKQ